MHAYEKYVIRSPHQEAACANLVTRILKLAAGK
jgi:hypothetical protein